MNWGKSIILAFILFAAFIATLVTVCMRQDVNLVTREYYQEELAYQAQIDRIAHTAKLSEQPSINLEQGYLLKISYPDFAKIQEGSLQLFRPSDADLDREFELRRSTDMDQYFSTAGMKRGMYRARLRWTMDDQEYFLERTINL